MIKPEDLTKEQFLEQILEICDKNPDKINPTDGRNNCVYEDPKGNHCIIGEWLSIHYPEIIKNMPVEEDGCKGKVSIEEMVTSTAFTVLDKYNFSPETSLLATRIQTYADGTTSYDPPVKWSKIKDKFECYKFY